MKKIWNLYHKYEEIINYIIVGALTTLVSLAVKYGLLFTIFNAENALELQASVIISWIAAVSFAYITNRVFVFKSKNKNVLKEVISFFGARVATLVMEMVIMWFFITLLGMNSDLWVLIWTFLTQVLIMIGNYILSKLFVFSK
ncbi:MAG: GtrA family protein [Bacilli bacterium]